MREVYENYSKHTKVAKQLQKHLLENFTKENQYAKFADAVYTQNQDAWLSEISNIIKEYE